MALSFSAFAVDKPFPMGKQTAETSLFEITGAKNSPTGLYSDKASNDIGVSSVLAPRSSYGSGTTFTTANFRSGDLNNYPAYDMNNNCVLVRKMGNPATGTLLFDEKILPEGSVLQSDSVVEISFTTQATIARTATQLLADGIALSCTVSQDGVGEQPCSNTTMYPFILRQQQNVDKPMMSMVTYTGYVVVTGAGTNPNIKIRLGTVYGTLATACYSGLSVKTGSIPN